MAQFPDIVPPQVQVTGSYPGADSLVVEQTVAQPIEQQVNGVDNMIYMQSTSGSDGSYTLTVTFELGTDPDINTVNVQNRVSLAEPQLPDEVTRQGLSVQEGVLGAAAGDPDLFAERHLRCPLSEQLRDDQPARRDQADQRRRQRDSCSARSTTRCGSGSIPPS